MSIKSAIALPVEQAGIIFMSTAQEVAAREWWWLWAVLPECVPALFCQESGHHVLPATGAGSDCLVNRINSVADLAINYTGLWSSPL